VNYFEYNGIRSSDMGLHIQRKNVYSSPKYDSSFVSIPGRNGDLIVPNRRYENTQVSYSVYLSAKNSQQLADSITKIKAWLYAQPDRYHILKDSYDKRFFRYALFNSSLDIEDELNKIGVFTVSFNCKPFRYDIDGELPHSIDVVLNFPYMIFCRMDGSKPENDWSNRWNQTADLVVPSGKNMFVLNTNSWTDGYWDSYSDADKSRIYLKVNEKWKKENARFALYTFLGDETAWHSLEKVSEDIYRVTLPSKGETVLVNPYSFESRPLIHLNGNGAGTLTIDNENGRHEWTFNDIDEFIEIDSEKMCFYKDNTLKNDTVKGTGFPLLVRGENRFILGGGITDGSVFPRWCSL
jgi:putative phage tail component, N-terminal domain protein